MAVKFKAVRQIFKCVFPYMNRIGTSICYGCTTHYTVSYGCAYVADHASLSSDKPSPPSIFFFLFFFLHKAYNLFPEKLKLIKVANVSPEKHLYEIYLTFFFCRVYRAPCSVYAVWFNEEKYCRNRNISTNTHPHANIHNNVCNRR